MGIPDRTVDEFGHVRLGGIGNVLVQEIEARTGIEARLTILGHVQRGGTPTAFDRVLSSWLGTEAVDAVHDGAFGDMVAWQGGTVVRVPLAEAVRERKTVSRQLLDVSKTFFG
jgi:6-phosphofructokinase 1